MNGSSYLTVLAVLAVAFGALGAWVAAEKGRSLGEGLALGLVFGPLGEEVRPKAGGRRCRRVARRRLGLCGHAAPGCFPKPTDHRRPR